MGKYGQDLRQTGGQLRCNDHACIMSQIFAGSVKVWPTVTGA